MDYVLQIILITGIFIILAMGLNIINGFCGQFSLGHAGLFGAGAYASAYFTQNLNLGPIPFMLTSLLIGGFAAFLTGLIVALPTLRLKGDYLAISTLGLSEIIRIIIINTEELGGPRGFINIRKMNTGPYLAVVIVLMIVVFTRLKFAKPGRAMQAILADEVASESLGINIFKHKLAAFLIGSFTAGMAGSLFAHTQQFLHPSNFSFMWSVIILVMVIFGGMGSIIGAIFGAVLLTIFPEAMRFAGGAITEWRMAIYALLLIVIVRIKPSGIFGAEDKLFSRYLR